MPLVDMEPANLQRLKKAMLEQIYTEIVTSINMAKAIKHICRIIFQVVTHIWEEIPVPEDNSVVAGFDINCSVV